MIRGDHFLKEMVTLHASEEPELKRSRSAVVLCMRLYDDRKGQVICRAMFRSERHGGNVVVEELQSQDEVTRI